MPPQPDNPLRAAAQPVSGTRRRLGNQPFFFVLGVIAAIIFTIGWGAALFSYSGNTLGQVHHQTFAWRIVSDTEARISFQTNSSSGARCLIRAYDEYHVEVGTTEVTVEGGLREVEATIDTVRRATTVQVVSCREQAFSNEPVHK
ncbi:hypothetical protein JCM3263A_05810 [Thermobifida fusca]|jgi:hypothetical protein|uniref:DUF4307 domain-containing protein n=2 Tax=Thermobifida fusca TaxID=2021 RepID=A0A9P2TDQ5_THEFU|nr:MULTISPECIES: DUF4307 domain-containing protein [Thermobifida]AAZ54486.1 hypothetical protein Tfu_0448 [Thermobifida fusca YX]EOR72456.1 hypothetical protein TM51_02584 [Thermobifida fusca TM51]MBO2529652.1 DUF4307 domain-containing protein [Thermobifida sp.]MDD6791198.1 DUF4307 domain-containing protein [Thermobifida fusca]PPS92271.1 hypothetical protein BH05_10955 [Thermobifida fusca]